MRLTRRLWTGYGGYALGFASLFVVWQLASLYLVSSVLFPPPTIVFHKGLVLAKNGVLLANLAASLQRILAGFVAGSLLGIPVGLAMGSFRFAHQLAQLGILVDDVVAVDQQVEQAGAAHGRRAPPLPTAGGAR